MTNGCFDSCTANFVHEGQMFDLTPPRARARAVTYSRSDVLGMAGPADTTQGVQGVNSNVITLLQRVLPQPKTTESARDSLHAASDSLNRLQDDGTICQLDAREQAGSDLWDATQSEGPATTAVANSGLDIIPQVVLHAISHQQLRLAELLLGALANILCHSRLAKLVIKVAGSPAMPYNLKSGMHTSAEHACI